MINIGFMMNDRIDPKFIAHGITWPLGLGQPSIKMRDKVVEVTSDLPAIYELGPLSPI